MVHRDRLAPCSIKTLLVSQPGISRAVEQPLIFSRISTPIYGYPQASNRRSAVQAEQPPAHLIEIQRRRIYTVYHSAAAQAMAAPCLWQQDQLSSLWQASSDFQPGRSTPGSILRREQGDHPVSGPRPVASRRFWSASSPWNPSHERCSPSSCAQTLPLTPSGYHSSLRPALQDRAHLQAGRCARSVPPSPTISGCPTCGRCAATVAISISIIALA